MEEAISTIGDYAGLASIFGLAVLSFLYFMQARHVRDLEEKATFVPDDIDLPATPPVAAAAETRKQPTVGASSPAAEEDPKGQLEAARQVEVARAAAERRERFEARRGGPFGGRSSNGGGRGTPEPRVLAIIGIGAAILLVGIIFLISRGGGGDEGTTASNPAESVQGTGAPKQVAFLNATPVSGLAGKISKELKGPYKTLPISNVETPFDETTVMYDKSDPSATQLAQEIAAALNVAIPTQPMTSEVKQASEGALVAVVVGEDRAGE